MNKQFLAACEATLDCCRDLYNAALQQRIMAHKQGRSIGMLEQCRQLTEARHELSEVGAVLCAFQQNTLRRLDKAYQDFFRRVKSKQAKAGFPRFKGYERYDSFNTRDSKEFRLKGDRLIVQKLGSCRIRLSRPMVGKPKMLTIRRECDGWYAVLACDGVEPKPRPQIGARVGIDVGLESFATLSTGETVPNPRWFRSGETALAQSQQRLAVKTKGSLSRKRTKRLLCKAYAKIRRQRDWFQWNLARSLVERFDLIAVEDLNFKGLSQSVIAKSVNDAAWASFINKLLVKAEEAAREVVKVSARFTSQDCSKCGQRQKKRLSERWHSCSCGLELSRDHNAAINILGRAVPDLKIEPAQCVGG